MSKPLRTPIFRVASSSLAEVGTDINGEAGKGAYYIRALFGADADLSGLQDEIAKAAKKEFGGKIPTNFFSPLKDQASYGDRDGFVPGNMMCDFKNRFEKPRIVGPDGRTRLEPEDIYNGCYCIATYYVRIYSKTGKGASLILGDIKKVKDGEPLSRAVPLEQCFDAADDISNVFD